MTFVFNFSSINDWNLSYDTHMNWANLILNLSLGQVFLNTFHSFMQLLEQFCNFAKNILQI